MGTIKIGSSKNKVGVTIEPKKVLFNGDNVKYIKSGLTEIWSYLTPLIPKMTSNTTPSGGAFCSSFFDANYDAYKAFDNEILTNWATTHNGRINAYIGYIFDKPTNVKKIYVLPESASSSSDVALCRLREFVFEGSNDGINYTLIYSTTFEITTSDEIGRTYSFNNPNYYLYYRLRQVGDNYSGQYATSIKSLQFYGTQVAET